MRTQDQYMQILNYLNTEDLFSMSHVQHCNHYITPSQYQRSDQLLSAMHNETIFLILARLMCFDDSNIPTIIKRSIYSGKFPLKFSVIETITLLFTLLPLALMCFDLFYSWTNLSVFLYVYISACGLSLYLTARIAKKEWMVHNWDEKER